MSTAQEAPVRRGEDEDPFRYGWRFVRRVGPDGSEEWEQVPLSLEDVLHPEEGDFHVLSDGHNEDCNYLKSVAKARVAGDPSAVVLSDCRVACDAPIRPLGPDVALLFGAGRHVDWSTFDVAVEGARPALVIEVTSPDTRVNDVGIKVEYYHRCGVPLYVIVDAGGRHAEVRRLRLVGYRWAPGGYEPMEPDDQGRLWLEPLGLWLGITRDRRGGYDRVALIDPESGREIGDYLAINEALAAEAQARLLAEAQAAEAREQADAAQMRADEAQSRADEARSQANEARTQADEAWTQAVEARSQAAEARSQAAEAWAVAEAEAKARADLEARLREMEAELRRARGELPAPPG